MEHTPSVEEMITVIQNYIYETKRIRVKIMFNDPMRMRRDTMMINEAYSIAVIYNNKNK